jgi:hypothetical protein
MKYYELDKYEKEILDALEKGKLKTIPNFEKEEEELQAIAQNYFEQNKKHRTTIKGYSQNQG